jgi:pimeloyl-ACP methyl ester carboxylesterase
LIKNIYIFSGLGADERVFQRLDFSDFSVTYIEWITPTVKESFEDYTSRIIEQIKTPKPILIGLSFGGMTAIEVAKQIETEKVILISSAKTRKEIPFYFRLVGKIGLHKLLPSKLLKNPNRFTNWFFGATSTFDKQLLKQILVDTDPTYLKWALDKIVSWENETKISNSYNIHGTKDRILPIRYVSCNKKIKKGGHFMILNKADELNEILHQQLNSI